MWCLEVIKHMNKPKPKPEENKDEKTSDDKEGSSKETSSN